MNKEQIESSQLEKAPEPAAITPYEKTITAIMKTIEHLAPDANKCRPVYQVSYTNESWCDVDHEEYEHQKNIGMVDVRILYTSPPEVAELQKQVQALQAENGELKNVADLARFLANTWEAIDRFVYANIDVDAIDKYPVIQGTSNQINLAKIGAQKYTHANWGAAIAYLLKEKS